MSLLGFSSSEIDRLFAFRSPCVSREAIERSRTAETTTVCGVRRMYECLTGYPYLARGAWVASKAHAGYWVPSESYGDDKTPNYDRLISVGQIFNLLDLLRPMATVQPVESSGTRYPMPRGAYGLAYPQCEIAVRAGGRLAWLIISQEIAGRVHAFVFDRFNVDGDEEPRPRGLYRIRRSYARLLVEAAGPLRNAPSECRPENGVEGLAGETPGPIGATTSAVGSEPTAPATDPEEG